MSDQERIGGDAQLPEVLAQVAESCGRSAAIALATALGGRQIYIPRPEHIDPDHALAQIIGVEKARCAAAALGRGDILIPSYRALSLQRRRAAFRAMKAAEKSHGVIAEALGVHVRTVERYAAEVRTRTDPDQLDMFE